ncbi:MAG: glycosyltransferase family 4 protein [Chloroflexi bacterium]|nr:glycosyltransferase family 4 protein [Chloroflexota bacterium]
MEQALGHATHYRNFRQVADQQSDVSPVWIPIPFEVAGPARFVPMLRSNWSVRASWRARRALDRVMAAGPLDAILFHTQVTSLFSISLMRRVPSLISLDATPINYDSVGVSYGHRAAGTGFVDRKKFELNQRAFQAARGLVTWSDWARKSLIDDYGTNPDRIRVVAPGAPRVYFDIGRTRSPEPAAQDGRKVRLLFVGGDFHRKGGPLLLDLMRGPLGTRCELHIATQTPLAPRPNVFVYHGLQPNSTALRDLFASADVFVLPTRADCLAVVLEEAAAAALPVVTTRVGALAEAVNDGESGLIVQPDDMHALGQALTMLVNDPPRRTTMGRAAHELARRRFDATQNNRALLDFMQEIAQPRFTTRRAA